MDAAGIPIADKSVFTAFIMGRGPQRYTSLFLISLIYVSSACLSILPEKKPAFCSCVRK
jgi:hypothetical protein